MPVRVVVLAVICLTLAAPASAQRMCPTVKSPVRADTGQKLVVKHQPTPTSPNAVCLRKDTVPVVVPPPLPPPLPPVDTAKPPVVLPPVGGSNEPADMVKLTEHDFSCLVPESGTCPNGWRYQWGYSGAFSAHVDTSAPRSKSAVVRENFTPALPSGSSPGAVYYSFRSGARGTLYVAYWMMLSADYVGHQTSWNKTVFLTFGEQNRIYTALTGSGSGPLIPVIGLQGLYSNYTAGGATGTSVNLTPNVQSVNVTRGVWHKFEVVLVANTNGQANGSATLWVDGVKVIGYGGIPFGQPGATFDAIAYTPTWGGGGPQNTATFWAAMDHIYVSGK